MAGLFSRNWFGIPRFSLLPKRMRCPHCDRLFSRDKLDNHIRRCKTRKVVTTEDRTPMKRRIVIVDGGNVAYHLAHDGTPKMRSLALAHRSLTLAGFNPVIVVSAALKHKIDRPEALETMIANGQVVQAARGTDDDVTIIKLAKQKNADIISNDRFLDWIERFPWLPSRLKKYRMTPSGLILN